MGLILGSWHFADGVRMPSARGLATDLARATGLQIVQPPSEPGSLEIPMLDEQLFLEYEGSTILLSSGIPAHPYLWENLDAVLEALGGERTPMHWHPEPRFRHLRRPWNTLTARRQFLLRLRPLGPWRPLDRFA